MRFLGFTIQRYRAVDNASIPVGNRLIPLVGINESGKTSILQAILSFDRNSDRYNGGAHLNYKNKYEVKPHSCTIIADIVLESERDLTRIAKRVSLAASDPLYLELRDRLESKKPIQIFRKLDDERRPYGVSGLTHCQGREARLAKAIYAYLPLILYFDDFTDRVPDEIQFNRAENEKGYKLRTSRLAQWQRVLEEVVSRATEKEYTLTKFIHINDEGDREGVLSDINDRINEEVIDQWRELKKWGGEFADDPDDLRLELRYELLKHGFRFRFKVRDRSRDKSRIFDIADRSKGFQWFFNFQMKLRFNPKYQSDAAGAIYLLDEPGSYLHSSAQEELLGALKQISETNTILYCTHSQHLLNPDKINIGQTRIVSKEDGRIQVIPFGSARTSDYQGALTPVIEALRIRTGVWNRAVRKAVITEGISDYYVLRMLIEHNDDWRFESVDLIPGAGASHLKELISFAIAWSESFLVVLDKDSEGDEAKARYLNFFDTAVRDRLIQLSESDEMRLEDLLSSSDKEKLKLLTGADKTKAALKEVFFLPADIKSRFWREIDERTVSNLEHIRLHIAELNDGAA